MRKAAFLFCVLFLGSCAATTQMTGFVDPNYRGKFIAQNVVVFGIGLPLDEQKILEETYIQSFAKYDVRVIQGLDLFPPTQDYTKLDFYKIAQQAKADLILIIDTKGRDVTESYVPPTYHPGKTTSTVSGFGNYATVNTQTSPGYTTGGYTVSMPVMRVNVYLKDIKTKNTIWIADGFSGGNGASSFSDLTVSVVKTSVQELAKEGLIQLKPVLVQVKK